MMKDYEAAMIQIRNKLQRSYPWEAFAVTSCTWPILGTKITVHRITGRATRGVVDIGMIEKMISEICHNATHWSDSGHFIFSSRSSRLKWRYIDDL